MADLLSKAEREAMGIAATKPATDGWYRARIRELLDHADAQDAEIERLRTACGGFEFQAWKAVIDAAKAWRDWLGDSTAVIRKAKDIVDAVDALRAGERDDG